LSEFTIVCRAKVSPECYDGDPTERQFGEDLPMREDGTYDWMGNTIVCDPCYIMLLPFTKSGMGDYNELPQAIYHLRTQLTYLERHDDPMALYEEAEAARNGARMGSPMYRSSEALMRLAMAEVERRKTA